MVSIGSSIVHDAERSLPSLDMLAPDSLNSLSPICIGKTLRAGSSIDAFGSVALRLAPPPGPPMLKGGLIDSKVTVCARGLRSGVPASLRLRNPAAPCEGPLSAGVWPSCGDIASSPDSDMVRIVRLLAEVKASVGRSDDDFLLAPATVVVCPEGLRGMAKPSFLLRLTVVKAEVKSDLPTGCGMVKSPRNGR